MIITDIKKQRKRLCGIYIDDEYAFSLDINIVAENCLKQGQSVDDEFLHKLIVDSETYRAKEKALWYLSNRDYSEKELYKKLLQESSPEIAEKIVERMVDLGLVDDYRYGKRLASDLINIKGMSARGVKYKLREKGINKELAEEISEEFEIDSDKQILMLLNKKYYRKMFDEKGRRQTIAALQRNGYSYSEIKSAINIFDEENDEDYEDKEEWND